MPGGKIAVYTGMLDITKNDDGLASVKIDLIPWIISGVNILSNLEEYSFFASDNTFKL